MDRLVKIAYDIIEDFSADSPIESKEEKEKDVEVNTSKYVCMCVCVCLSIIPLFAQLFWKKIGDKFFQLCMH